jgi:hypothetical protein
LASSARRRRRRRCSRSARTLSLRRLGGSLGPVAAMIAAKLGLHPLLAFLAFDWLLGLDRL